MKKLQIKIKGNWLTVDHEYERQIEEVRLIELTEEEEIKVPSPYVDAKTEHGDVVEFDSEWIEWAEQVTTTLNTLMKEKK